MASHKNSKRFSDKVRQVADELKVEDELQKRITARILGAAAQISNNHEHLIDEVAEVSRDDIDRIEALQSSPVHSVRQLKLKFKTLSQAKAHFGVTARSWKSLVEKLNSEVSELMPEGDKRQEQGTTERLAQIEQRLEQLQVDVQTILGIVSKLIS